MRSLTRVWFLLGGWAASLILSMFLPRSRPIGAVCASAVLALLLAKWIRFARRLPRAAPLARAAIPVTGLTGIMSLAAAAGVITAIGWSLWVPFLAFAGLAFVAAAVAIWWPGTTGRAVLGKPALARGCRAQCDL